MVNFVAVRPPDTCKTNVAMSIIEASGKSRRKGARLEREGVLFVEMLSFFLFRHGQLRPYCGDIRSNYEITMKSGYVFSDIVSCLGSKVEILNPK